MRSLLLLCLSLALLAPAQEKPAAQAPPAPGAPMPKASPEMRKLIKTFRGVWTTSEKHEPSPIMPNGGTGKGQARFMPGPGGLSLIENYTSQSGAGRFVAHGVTWWDPDQKVYSGIWCDNTSANGCETGGTMKWDGDKLLGTMETSMTGHKAKLEETYSNITPNSFTYTMDMNVEGSMSKRMMTIEFTRAGAAPAPPAEKKQ